MIKRRPEVADVFREHEERFFSRFGSQLGYEQRRAFRDLSTCRTAALGGHKYACSACGDEEISYNSCRNRHCPKCQASRRAEWLEKEASYLLDVPYFHVVFTLPADVARLALSNKREVYNLLIRAAARTLSTIARDPKHLGAEIGFLMVLHTWGQTLGHHPHVHCVVPAGGLSPQGDRWVHGRPKFLLPIKVLSRLFRGKLLAYLRAARADGKLRFTGELADLDNADAWREFLRPLSAKKRDWVVYAKRPFGGPKQVLKYLARYTHRVAISNRRILSAEGGRVRFSWKDYAQGGKKKIMTLDAEEFIRRFIQHVLPKGFVRIRHFGILSNRTRQEKLALARGLIARDRPANVPPASSDGEVSIDAAEIPHERRCPRCDSGVLEFAGEIEKSLAGNRRTNHFDTS